MLLGDLEEELAYLVPLNALGFGAGEEGDFVFLFDESSSTVQKTAVRHEGIRDDNVIIQRGLRAGDIVVTAGVSFLQDGQQVRLMGQ